MRQKCFLFPFSPCSILHPHAEALFSACKLTCWAKTTLALQAVQVDPSERYAGGVTDELHGMGEF